MWGKYLVLILYDRGVEGGERGRKEVRVKPGNMVLGNETAIHHPRSITKTVTIFSPFLSLDKSKVSCRIFKMLLTSLYYILKFLIINKLTKN